MLCPEISGCILLLYTTILFQSPCASDDTTLGKVVISFLMLGSFRRFAIADLPPSNAHGGRTELRFVVPKRRVCMSKCTSKPFFRASTTCSNACSMAPLEDEARRATLLI